MPREHNSEYTRAPHGVGQSNAVGEIDDEGHLPDMRPVVPVPRPLQFAHHAVPAYTAVYADGRERVGADHCPEDHIFVDRHTNAPTVFAFFFDSPRDSPSNGVTCLLLGGVCRGRC